MAFQTQRELPGNASKQDEQTSGLCLTPSHIHKDTDDNCWPDSCLKLCATVGINDSENEMNNSLYSSVEMPSVLTLLR